MGHTPVLKPNGYTCCGFDDPDIKWYRNEEFDYSIAARSPEEAEQIVISGMARFLRQIAVFGLNLYNNETKSRMARGLRRARVEMTECCLADIRQEVDTEF